MAIDKVKWHTGAENFPANMSQIHGATHIGMFIDWAVSRDLTNERLNTFSPIGAWLLRHRLISGRMFILLFCDGMFSSGDHLNKQGDEFADSYYDGYTSDFESLVADHYKTPYHVANTRANRARVRKWLMSVFRPSRAARRRGSRRRLQRESFRLTAQR